MPSPDSQRLEAFLNELALYRGPLRLALEKVLGQEKASDVLRYLHSLENRGGYISDPRIAGKLGAFFVGREEDLGFYVTVTHGPDFSLDVAEEGRVVPAGTTVQCRPVFLYWPTAIAGMAEKVKGYPLPRYFTPWVHEFGHFLCYWLQPHPMMAAISVVVGALAKRGIDLGHIEDLERLDANEMPGFSRQLVQMLLQWSGLNEAMAIWWEAQLLAAMEFKVRDWLGLKKRENPFVGQLEGRAHEDVLSYIEKWSMPKYYREEIPKNFLESFAGWHIDKWSFLNDA